jgi:hypothetical protein
VSITNRLPRASDARPDERVLYGCFHRKIDRSAKQLCENVAQDLIRGNANP